VDDGQCGLHHKFEKLTLQVRAAPPPAGRGKMLWTEYHG